MNDQIFQLEPQFEIELVSDSLEKSLSPAILQAIEEEWQHEQQKRTIFNGKIFDVLSANSQKLTGRFVEYRSYIAQLRNPNLKKSLPIHILGVTGLTLWKDRLLLGRRADDVTLYPSFYEFAPAGGVDATSTKNGRIDIQKQALAELEEELGIDSSRVKSITPAALMQSSDGYEIVVKILLDSNQAQKFTFPKQEYSECIWLKYEDLKKFAEEHRRSFVPLSFQILNYLGL